MTGRQLRRSTRLSVVQPAANAAAASPIVDRTRFRQPKPNYFASDSESSDADDDIDANIENVNTNRQAAASAAPATPRRGRPPKNAVKPAAAAAASSSVIINSTTAATQKMGAKRKSTKTGAAAASEPAAQPNHTGTSDENDDRKSEATPPKLVKFTSGGGEQKLAPVMLLDKLSLTSPTRKTTATPAAATARSRFQNARITLNSAETYSLPGRESELEELSDFLSAGLHERRSASMYISGPPGTGKTACLSKLLNASAFSAQFQRVYVNCTSIASIGSIYKKVCAELGLRVGTEKECLLAIEQHLGANRQRRTVLMVLDEVDQLVGKKQSVLYTIFEWPAKPNSNLLLIGIANSLDLTDRCLSRLHAKCELKPRLMHFAPYTKAQIVGIFRARLEEAGVAELFPPVTIQLLAAKVASVSGDVRKALDIGRRVIEMAEEQRRAGAERVALDELAIGIGELRDVDEPAGAAAAAAPAEKVELKQVMQVLNQVYGASQTLGSDADDTFPLQQKILICTVLLILRCDKNKDITVGRLHGVYAKVCGARNIAALGRSEFAGLCELVETRGIVRIIKNKEPRLCKVQMQWDEQEVTAALQDKQMIASILADASCLSATRGK